MTDFRCGKVAIVGRPNVGKSTLMNHLIGMKLAITSRKPQTTRHRIAGVVTTPDAQFVFLDTPGFQESHKNALNRLLNRTVAQAAEEADVVVFLLDGLTFDERDQRVLALLPKDRPVVLAINKVDRLDDKSRLLPHLAALQERFPFVASVPISAKQGHNLDKLKAELRQHLPDQPAMYGADDFTDRSEKFLVAEFIREKVFRYVGDELPYSSSVVIEQWQEEGRLRRIHAAIVVEKTSQRAILIGKGGEKLKQIGTEARLDLEKLLDCKIYLELWVRVKKGWADDDRMIRQYGYE